MKQSKLIKRFRVDRPKSFKLAEFDPAETAGFKKPKAETIVKAHAERLGELQERLYAEDRWSLLIILQGVDAAGKDGVIKRVMADLNPQGCAVHPFKVPTSEELEHDFLWRVVKRLPYRGDIAIFIEFALAHASRCLTGRSVSSFVVPRELLEMGGSGCQREIGMVRVGSGSATNYCKRVTAHRRDFPDLGGRSMGTDDVSSLTATTPSEIVPSESVADGTAPLTPLREVRRPRSRLRSREVARRAGASVYSARSVQDGLRLARRPDLSAAVVDFGLGDGDGAGLCELLKARGVPFVLHTGYAHPSEACHSGVLVPKPAAPHGASDHGRSTAAVAFGHVTTR